MFVIVEEYLKLDIYLGCGGVICLDVVFYEEVILESVID